MLREAETLSRIAWTGEQRPQEVVVYMQASQIDGFFVWHSDICRVISRIHDGPDPVLLCMFDSPESRAVGDRTKCSCACMNEERWMM